MAKQATTPPIEQNPYVKELLDVLKKHNQPGAEDLKAMIANAAKIEAQLAAALAEMAAMRRELAAIREDNHPLRKVTQNAVSAAQEHIKTLHEQLEKLKAAIIEGCKNALVAFKERGAAAINGERYKKLTTCIVFSACASAQLQEKYETAAGNMPR